MTTIYINDSGNYGETVIFAEGDQDKLLAGLVDCFGSDFKPDVFLGECDRIDLVEAINAASDDDYRENDARSWHRLVRYFVNDAGGTCMAGARETFAPFYARWQTLNTVTTPGEIADEYGIADATVRQAIARDDIPARKSGGTWLIIRADAEARWGSRR